MQRALGEEEPVDGFSAEKIKSRYLTRHLEKGDKFFKLILSQTDDLTLRSIIQERELPFEKSTRVSENFDFFAREIELLKGKFEILCRGIAKLAIVDIALNRGEDNPQLIFESMNSTGKALSQADLIRNYILMGLKPDLQTRLYESYWRPMELEFGQSAYGEEFDAFMRHYLTIKLSEIPRIDQIYDNFKFHARKEDVAKEGVEALVKNLRVYSQYYCAMSLGKEQDPALNRAFMDLKEFKVDVAYPFLLEVYGDYKSDQLSKSDFIEIIRMVESYAFRRAVVQIPANSMNKTFSRFLLSIDRAKYLESVKAVFASLKSYRRFPNDDEFARALKVRDLYNFRRGAYWLRKLENFNRKELPVLEEYSIEHILPQNEELNSWWQKALGENWSDVQGRLIHTIGNLTLTRYNSEFSDNSFPEKRDLPEGGFKTSPLALNQGLAGLDTWNEETINERAKKLVEKALKVWTLPVADPAILKALLVKEKQTARPTYTYEDHRYLQNEVVLDLFTSLKTQILAIDSAVYEEVLKLYVAFKADTNFVDVVFKSAGLRLTINLPFDDLQDPKHLAENVKGKGRWGNGEVSLEVDSSDDVSYAMFLIKQAYDRQFDEN